MKTRFLTFELVPILAVTLARAQPLVTPTPDMPDEIEKAGDYTISNSFEVGYRMSDVSGNHDVYRSSVNFGSGVRLFEGQLRINAKEGKATLIDNLSFHTMGQGEDPYQFTRLEIEKNRWFRYGMQLRVNRFFNRLPALWSGERGQWSERTFQNHDLRLFPDSRFEVLLGYDRNSQTGPGFGSEGINRDFGAFRNENFLRLTRDLRRQNNQYRAGFDTRVAGLAITFMQALDNYKEDTVYGDGSRFGSLSPNVQPVDSLQRNEPIHGNTPVTSVAIRTENEHKIGFQGRYVYASGNRHFILSEDITAVNSDLNLSSFRQTFIVGDAQRKQGNGDFTVTFMPTDRWTISNTTSVNNTRISGDSTFVEVTASTNRFQDFEHLGIRHISNASEVNFQAHRKFGLYGAYRFSRRRIQSRENFFTTGFDFVGELFEQSSDINSGVGGFRWRPRPELRVSFDAEFGKADLPFTPRSDREFHSETVRVQWRKNGFLLGGSFKSRENDNSAMLINHSTTSRHFGFNGSWAHPGGKLTLDGGYAKLELDTASGIFNFFPEGETPAESRSFYTMNLHTVYFSTRLQPRKRLSVYLAYNLSNDTGDGRSRPSFAAGLDPTYPNFSFDGANFYNSFPLTYQSPSARVSVSLHEHLSWNLGWQYYGYSERFIGDQNYHAHVSYSSLRWSF